MTTPTGFAVSLYRAMRTLYEMMRDRGHPTLKDHDGHAQRRPSDVSAFIAALPTAARERQRWLLRIALRANKPKTCIVWSLQAKVGVNVVRDYIKFAHTVKATSIILVHSTALTPFAKSFIRDNPLSIQPFSLAELQYNVSRHETVPRHRMLTSAERREVMGRVNLRKLPKLLSNDTIVRYYSFPRGAIVEITVPSSEGHSWLMHRIVV